MQFFRFLLIPFSFFFRKNVVLFYETHHGSGSNVFSLYSSWSSDSSFPFTCYLIRRKVRGLRSRLQNELLLLRARWIVQDHGGRAWYPGQQVIELWHGIPLKGMDGMDATYQDTMEPSEIIRRMPELVLSCGQMYETLFSACRYVPGARYRRFGFPRLRWLQNDRSNARATLSKVLGRSIDDKLKVLLWMPTHRKIKSNGNGNGTARPDGSSSRLPALLDSWLSPELERVLQQNGCLLVMKPHPNDEGLVRSRTDALGSQVVLLTSDDYSEHTEDLYCLLPATDALITDYSSVYFDYLLLDRPIGFVVEDLDRYRQQRGFLLEPVERWMPGEHIRSVTDLEEFISYVAVGRDPHRPHRQEMSDMFFPAGIQDTATLLAAHLLDQHRKGSAGR
ncbi:CDP-glycerol glycerophosphotransferase family protein [Wenzhouxiangella sp. EGI_FJ10305]|uniref:CDP-glycerol glycerophosphotransferase family protein n=1 Tax=Wenzhouxiangella sp. EGI_FJ10305 TaxID=3243768 RepID=UPI0035E09521